MESKQSIYLLATCCSDRHIIPHLHQNRQGITLLELVVVLAIIGTLVGLLLPAVMRVRE